MHPRSARTWPVLLLMLCSIAHELPRIGLNSFTDVRQGKRFELTVEGEATEEHLAQARQAAEELLSNPVIEDVVNVSVLED